MKILLVGSGGREHALAWRLRQDDPALELFIAPGNAGTAQVGTNLPFQATDLAPMLEWAHRERPGLTIVGPEAPLVAGIVDLFEAEGLPCFGPHRAAARLEGSKVFSKQLLLRHGLPTAPGECFSDSKGARAYLAGRTTFPQVIKADGLAAGKGVLIAPTLAAAEHAVGQIMDERIFGDAGAQVVIEEFLPGREMSVHVLADGRSHILLPIAQDHKKLLDGDLGPNTGGMGAYAPAPFATPAFQQAIDLQVVRPVLAAFRADGLDFRGILFIGLIWTAAGPSILEFNVRGGDPETQVLLPLIDAPLMDLLLAVRAQRLDSVKLRVNDRHAVSLVLAAPGYPDAPRLGAAIAGIGENTTDSVVFHAGTRQSGAEVAVAGGRVLSVTAWAENLAAARDLAYARAQQIHFAGCQVRGDIAARLTLE